MLDHAAPARMIEQNDLRVRNNALGILMALHALGPEEAFMHLIRECDDAGVAPLEYAAQLVNAYPHWSFD